jgi:hypothetical protein
MPRKKKGDIEVPNPLKVDEAEFTDVIRRMVNTSPITRAEVEARGKKRRGVERRKNPETDPRYLPVFDFVPLTEEQKTEIRKQQKLFAKHEKKKH